MAAGGESLMQAPNRLCAICGQDDAEVLFHPKSSPGPVARCRRCRLVYVLRLEDGRAVIRDGPVLADQDPAVLHSTDLHDVAGCWEFAHLPAKLTETPALRRNACEALGHIERFVRPPGRLLDFGCGWGFFLGAARERGWEPYGLEPLPGHAVFARNQFGAKVVADVLREDAFQPGFFDAITSFQVFEHLPDPDGDLARLYGFLKPGGLILIEVPTLDVWSARLFGSRHRHFNPDHVNFFSFHTLEMLLEKRGFQVLGCYHPTRYMTFRHLVVDWGGRYLPGRVNVTLSAFVKRLGLWRRMVGINLRDIIAVVAQRRL
jgi:SAM-dependent methyltransferase